MGMGILAVFIEQGSEHLAYIQAMQQSKKAARNDCFYWRQMDCALCRQVTGVSAVYGMIAVVQL